jgi:hypothetical protein
VEDERLKGEEKHTCGGLMEASWGELVAYIVGWQWYGAAYWREFCGTREKQNESGRERERERERDQNHMCAARPGAKKKQKTN